MFYGFRLLLNLYDHVNTITRPVSPVSTSRPWSISLFLVWFTSKGSAPVVDRRESTSPCLRVRKRRSGRAVHGFNGKNGLESWNKTHEMRKLRLEGTQRKRRKKSE